MKVFFVRHGVAKGDLIESGRRQIKSAANFLKELNLDITQICMLTSPQERAKSSAEIIWQMLGTSSPKVVNWLDDGEGGGNIPEMITKFFVDNSNCKIVIAVSHMPEIEGALEGFGEMFESYFNANVVNASIHLVDLDTKTIQRLFRPQT